MSSAKNTADNYRSICEQIRRAYKDIAEMKRRKVEIEKELEQILSRVDGPGIVLDGAEISLEKKKVKTRVGKKQKQEEIARILQEHHVSDPEGIIKEIYHLGSFEEKSVVKIRTK